MKDIERAIEWFKGDLEHNESNLYDVQLKAYITAHNCLKRELARLENNPLSIQELKNMIGKPVWERDEDGYVLIFALENKYDKGHLVWYVEYILLDGDKKRYKLKDCVFYRNEPKIGECL